MFLLEDLMQNAKVDREAYTKMVDLIQKGREDAKKDQRSCFNTLFAYGTYGTHNSSRDVMSIQKLKDTDPQEILNLLKNLKKYEQTVCYYGPMSEQEISAIVTKLHKTPKKLMTVPEGKSYEMQEANQNEILLAPYDAKNIYMRMYHNENRPWQPEEAGVRALFNEYFGGGMNGIVFQELREARGLAYNAAALYNRPAKKDQKESFFTHIITQNDKMMDCVKEFHNILNEMPASENAFRIAKDAVTKQLASQRVTKFSVISDYLMAKRRGIDYDINEKVYNALPALTLQDIVDFEKQVMANKQYRYIILGDEKELDMKALEQLGPIRRLTTEEIFGY